MLAARDEYLREASNTMFELSTDEQIRKQCRDREEYYQDLRKYEKTNAQKEAVITEKDAIITEKEAVITEKDTMIAERDVRLKEATAETERLRMLLKQHGIDDAD